MENGGVCLKVLETWLFKIESLLTVVPVFQELTQYKGKLVQEMSWSALAHIETKYESEPLSAPDRIW